jgi:2-polyprenyl-6-methoxyphenol hydroxylase-like FAD-dependent oxidoreductase
MDSHAADVVVIGGGIAGSGLASMLARAGVSVTVLERTKTFPDRVRGEMWTPWGVAIADEIGLLAPLVMTATPSSASRPRRWPS